MDEIIVIAFWEIVEGISDTDAICSAATDLVQEIEDNEGDLSPLDDLSTSVRSKLDAIVDEEDDCEGAFAFLFDLDQDTFGISSMTERNETISEVCSLIQKSFGDDVDFESVWPEFASSWSTSEGGFPFAKLEYLIPIFGLVFNADSFDVAFDKICDDVPDEDKESALVAMCVAWKDRDLDNYVDICHQAFIWGEDFYDGDDEDTDGEFLEYQLGIIWEAIQYGLAHLDDDDLSQGEINPFAVCEALDANLDRNITDIVDEDLVPFLNGVFKALVYDIEYSFFCSDDVSVDFTVSVQGDESGGSPYHRFQTTLLRLLVVIGGYESPSEVCDLSTSLYGESSGSSSGVDTLVEGLFTKMADQSGCTEIFDVLVQSDTADFEEMTGFTTADELCTVWISAIDGSYDLSSLEFPTNMSSQSMLSDYFESILAMGGAAVTSETGKDALVTVCDSIAEPLGILLDAEDEVAEMCTAYASGNEGTQMSCERILVPVLYGPNYPLSLRPFDKLLEGEFLPWLLDFAGLPEELEEMEIADICPALEHVLNMPYDIYGLVFALTDGLFDVLGDSLVNICMEQKKVSEFIESEFEKEEDEDEDKDYSSKSSDMFNEDGEEEFTFEDLQTIEALAGFATGLGSFEGMCDALLEANSLDDRQSFLDELRNSVITLWTSVPRCEKLLDPDQPWWEAMEETDLQTYMYLFTGTEDSSELCRELVFYMTQEAVGE